MVLSNKFIFTLLMVICDQIWQKVHCSHTMWKHRFHHHSLINKQCMCVWMPTAHQSDFAVAAFCGMPDIHECSFIFIWLCCLLMKSRLAVNHHMTTQWYYPLIWLILWYGRSHKILNITTYVLHIIVL